MGRARESRREYGKKMKGVVFYSSSWIDYLLDLGVFEYLPGFHQFAVLPCISKIPRIASHLYIVIDLFMWGGRCRYLSCSVCPIFISGLIAPTPSSRVIIEQSLLFCANRVAKPVGSSLCVPLKDWLAASRESEVHEASERTSGAWKVSAHTLYYKQVSQHLISYAQHHLILQHLWGDTSMSRVSVLAIAHPGIRPRVYPQVLIFLGLTRDLLSK